MHSNTSPEVMPEGRPTAEPTTKSDFKYIYLDFLDKEMSIMGILSAFSVAVVSLFLQQIGTAKDNVFFQRIFQTGYWYVILGSVLVILAAGGFYYQRGKIAGYYGHIAKSVDFQLREQVREYIERADCLKPWVSYFIAFKSLYAGMVFYALALVSERLAFQWCVVGVTIGFFAVWASFEAVACIRYPHLDRPLDLLLLRPQSAHQKD
jgi:hypothetical protein